MQWIALIYLVLLSSCANNAEPQLEEWGEGSYKARQVSAYNINGKRDGATTRATASTPKKIAARERRPR